MPADAAVLVVGRRSGLVETVHRGHAVLCDAGGTCLWHAGDTSFQTYPRSALKFFQTLPLLQTGVAEAFGFSDEELAVMCASHSGEARHTAVVASILAKAGLDPGGSQLQCGGHFPLGFGAGEALLRAGGAITPLHSNCSGKHAGFLAYCVLHKLPLETYLHFDHPLQAAIRAEIAHFAGVEEGALHAGTDGCSAPAYALPLAACARAYAQLGAVQACPGREAARRRLVRAVLANPYMIGGEGRFCTELMACRCNGSGDGGGGGGSGSGGVLGKLGADGFYAVTILRGGGMGLCVKIEDGAHGPQYSVVAQALEDMGVVGEGELKAWACTPVKTVVGAVVGGREVVREALKGLPSLGAVAAQ